MECVPNDMGGLELGERGIVAITPSCADLGALLAELAGTSSTRAAADRSRSGGLGGRSLSSHLGTCGLMSGRGLRSRSGLMVSRSGGLSLDRGRRLGRFTAGRAHRLSLGSLSALGAGGGRARFAALALIALLLRNSTVLKVAVHMGVTKSNSVGGRGPESDGQDGQRRESDEVEKLGGHDGQRRGWGKQRAAGVKECGPGEESKGRPTWTRMRWKRAPSAGEENRRRVTAYVSCQGTHGPSLAGSSPLRTLSSLPSCQQ